MNYSLGFSNEINLCIIPASIPQKVMGNSQRYFDILNLGRPEIGVI